MTAVAPPNVHSRSWSAGLEMTPDFMPRSKASQRYSTPQSSPAQPADPSTMASGNWVSSLGGKKSKPAQRHQPVPAAPQSWPKSDPRQQQLLPQPPMHQPGPILPSQHMLAAGALAAQPAPQQSFLMLLPLNATFERKQIPLPVYPDTLRIGRPKG